MKDGVKKVLKVAIFSSFIGLVLILTSQTNLAFAKNQSENNNPSLVLVNSIREKYQLNDLKWNPELAKAAQDKALDMENYNYFDHISPNGTKAWAFILNENYEYLNAGENLAIDFPNVNKATIAWEASPTHLKNIVSSDYDEFGSVQMKINIEGRATDVYVQIFGREKPVYDRILNNIVK